MKKILLSFGVTIGIMLSSCGGDPVSGPDYTSFSADMKASMKRLKESHSFTNYTLDPVLDNEILTTGGHVIYFPAGSFRKNGTLPFEETVHLQVTELNTTGDIIRYHSSTMTDRYDLLESGGQLHIIAKDAAGDVIDAVGYTVRFSTRYTEDMPKTMGLFRGERDDRQNQAVVWNADMLGEERAATEDSVTLDKLSFSFDEVDGLGYLNLDRYLEAGADHNVKIRTDIASLNPSNTVVYCIFNDMKVVGTLYGYDVDDHSFKNQPAFKFPDGYSVKFFIFSNVSGQVYYSITDDYIISEDLDIHVSMTASTEEEVLSQLVLL